MDKAFHLTASLDASSSRNAEAGFTLLELLVALTLLGLLTTLLFAGLHLGMRAGQRGTTRLEAVSQLAIAQEFLRGQIAVAQPAVDTADPTRPAVVFDGAPDRLALVAPVPAHFAPGGLYVVTIDRERDSLLFRASPYRPLVPTAWELPPTRLLDQVGRIDFAYFGAPGAREAPDWHETWRGYPRLPMLVRLRITFADGSTAPDLVAALRLAAPGEQQPGRTARQ